MIDVQTALLFDFYGQLLTEKQQDVCHLYFEDDCSLSEIAEELQVSRQAVHDMIKKSRKALGEYEEKLGLAVRFLGQEEALKTIGDIAGQLMEEVRDTAASTEDRGEHITLAKEPLLTQLRQIRTIISELEQEI